MPTKTPRWYFSFRSPYSWLAYRDLIDRYPDVADSIEWIPFWEPDSESASMLREAGGNFAYVPMSPEKHRYILQDLRRLAAEREINFRWPVDRDPHWEVAHLGYIVANREGRGRAYVDEVYRSRWELGEDISESEVVAAAAWRAGLDGQLVASAQHDPDVRAEGRDVLLRIDRDGVFGVPFFVSGHDKYWGVERLPSFAAVLRGQVMQQAPVKGDEPMFGPLAGADCGHAGGCG